MTTPMKRTAPIAHVRRFRLNPRNADYLELDVLCPHCGCEHRHVGHTDDGPDFGHRASHCGATTVYRVLLTVRRPPKHKEETQ